MKSQDRLTTEPDLYWANATEIARIVEIVADWARPASETWVIYLFGSRMTGTHHADSDLDMHIENDGWDGDSQTDEWWDRQNAEGFGALEERLGFPIHLPWHGEPLPPEIYKAFKSSKPIGRIVIAATPPKQRS
jgi:hypothetical protein